MEQVSNYRLDGVILCGGKGSRLGGKNKGLIPFHHQPLVLYQQQKIHHFCHSILVSNNHDEQSYQKYNLATIKDIIPGYSGPLAGIHAAMETLKNTPTSHLLVLAVDYPYLDPQVFSRLTRVSRDYPQAIIAAYHQQQVHPLVAIYPVNLRTRLEQALNKKQYGVCRFLHQHPCRYVDFNGQPLSQWENINYPEQLYNEHIRQQGKS